MRKAIGFERLQRICEDKRFKSNGNGYYFVACKRGIPFCNARVCPEWNDLEDAAEPLVSLKAINEKLKSSSTL